jgi:hypothetical protein
VSVLLSAEGQVPAVILMNLTHNDHDWLCYFFITMTKYPKNNLRRQIDFCLTVSKVSVHQGRENVAEQSSSHHDSQEAKREGMPMLASFLLFSL